MEDLRSALLWHILVYKGVSKLNDFSTFKTFQAFVFAGIKMVLVTQIPAAIYDGDLGGDAPVKLNIGNGGAGQSGLIKGISWSVVSDQ